MRRFLVPIVVLALAISTGGAFAHTQTVGDTRAAVNHADHGSGIQQGPVAQVGPAAVVDASLGLCFTATLSGANEVPPNTSTATGSGTFVMSPNRGALTYYITFGGLSAAETAAHFHKAAVGVAGPVVQALPAGSPKQSQISISAQDAADIQNGLWYVNIHSSNFSGGEIRGQLVPSNACYAATLNGAAEVPANASTATGAGTFALAADKTLVYDIGFSGLSANETAAHFHKAPLGTAGPVVHPLPAGTTKRGIQLLTDAEISDLKAGLWYVNIHSTVAPGGEIRGQIYPATNCFTAILNGQNEVPMTFSTATGMGMFSLTEELSGTTTVQYLNFTITSTGIETPTVQHIHSAPLSQAGPVLYPLPSGNPKIGRILIDSQTNIDLLRGGLLYVNLHSETYPGGEIRGQIIPALCGLNLPLVVVPEVSIATD